MLPSSKLTTLAPGLQQLSVRYCLEAPAPHVALVSGYFPIGKAQRAETKTSTFTFSLISTLINYVFPIPFKIRNLHSALNCKAFHWGDAVTAVSRRNRSASAIKTKFTHIQVKTKKKRSSPHKLVQSSPGISGFCPKIR